MDEFELSLGEVSERVGRSKPAISNKLRLLELSDDVLAMVERGELTEGHARAVLAVPDQAERRRLARKIVAQGMSVRAAERAARWSGARTKPRTKTPVDPGARRARQGRVSRALTGLEVRVGAGQGRARLRRRARPRGARRGARVASGLSYHPGVALGLKGASRDGVADGLDSGPQYALPLRLQTSPPGAAPHRTRDFT